MRCRRAPFLLCAVFLGGCVTHEVRVTPGPPPATAVAVGSHVVSESLIEQRSSLPIELPLTAWRQDADGTLWRSDLIVHTPTPWWQRFPSDLISDALMPGTYEVVVTQPAAWSPAGGGDIDGLTARARAAGYAAAPGSPSP